MTDARWTYGQPVRTKDGREGTVSAFVLIGGLVAVAFPGVDGNEYIAPDDLTIR